MSKTKLANAEVDSELILQSPVARAFTVIGDRWAGLVLRDLFLGFRRFEDFLARSGAARGTLSSRLKALVEFGVIRRVAYQQSPKRYEYRLTRMGRDLYAFILAVWNWEMRWGGELDIPPLLVHLDCGQAMQPEIRCSSCDELMNVRAVRFSRRQPRQVADALPARFQRRSRNLRTPAEGVDQRFFHVLDIIGDRWTGLVLAACFFGKTRYDEIGKAIGIATNILAHRLKLLVQAGVLRREAYQARPRRYRYRLTEKGSELYLVTLEMHAWAERWLVPPAQRALLLYHRPCGSQLETRLACSACGGNLTVHNVTFSPDEATSVDSRGESAQVINA